ncbi:hypothetical protein ACLOJK_019288 [Asimina triloba]
MTCTSTCDKEGNAIDTLWWACFQLSEGYSSGLQEIFEEFLCKWKYVDGKGYVLENRRPHATADEGYSFLAVEKYLEVSEVYIFTLLRAVLGDIDLAISWVEKAELPEEKREEMLRRLHSLYSRKQSTSALVPSQSSDRNSSHTLSGSVTSRVEGFSGAAEKNNALNSKPAIIKSKYPFLERLSEKIGPCFWWFRTVTLEFCDARLPFNLPHLGHVEAVDDDIVKGRTMLSEPDK